MSPSDKMKEGFIPYNSLDFSPEEGLQRSEDFYALMNRRRSIRSFSNRAVDRRLIENAIKTAGTAPSGANKQPWTFCVVEDPVIRKKIREAAEAEEHRNYTERMSDRWLQDLEPLGTDHVKPFITDAPYLVVMFKQAFGYDEAGKKVNHYYVNESAGIAAGMFITALHNMGLCTLTHTPSPMNFLERILERPPNERAYLNLPVGYPAEDVQVPDIQRKVPEDFIKWY
jgi:nitroreductase